MAGGLVQIISYGTQDLTLTGNPQITFFKTVFKRYTNFGSSVIELNFDNPADFGTTSTITIPHNGDLLAKTTLFIRLPIFNIDDLNNDLQRVVEDIVKKDIEKINIYYDFFINFISKLKYVIKQFFLKNIYNTHNSSSMDLKIFIEQNISIGEYLKFFDIIDFFLLNNPMNVKKWKYSTLFKLVNNKLIYIYNDLDVNALKTITESCTNTLDELNILIYGIIQSKINVKNTINIEWIDKLAIHIIDNVELSFGSNVVTNLKPIYIDLYGQLYYKNVELYNSMIGNPVISQKYLYLPIPFWYLNNYGLAIPLIAFQHNDLQLKFKFKNLIDCIKFNVEIIDDVYKNMATTAIHNFLSLNNNVIFKSFISITILAEYIFLDAPERKKFAQSSHEYLITQVQEIVFNNNNELNTSKIIYDLNLFHCCKNLWWCIYDVDNNNKIVIDGNITLNLNGKKLISQPNIFYNYLQPYIYYNNTPDFGTNSYSFSLNPTEAQPSGAINLSRIQKFTIEFDNINCKNYVLYIYAENYNVIRFIGGVIGIAFSY